MTHLNKVGLSFFYLLSVRGVTGQTTGHLPILNHDFIVVAHRGDHTHAPENTLMAFSNAIQEGVDFIEIDLRTTADSQLVIMHDATVDRMTDGKGQVNHYSFDSIRKLTVTNRAHPEWGTFQIPSFREVLALSKNKIDIYLDFKSASPAEAYKEILEAGMEKQVVVYINQAQQIRRWRDVDPDMPLMISLPDAIKDTTALKDLLQQARVNILDGDVGRYSGEMVTVANRLGYWVLPDIQGPDESPAWWDAAIRKGIKALQTDHPADLIHYLETRHLR